MQTKLLSILSLLGISFSLPLFSQQSSNGFAENRNQWPSAVQYALDIPGGRVFLEKNSFTVALVNMRDVEALHEAQHAGKRPLEMPRPGGHAYKLNFVGASERVSLSASGKLKKYHNYFIGNNPAAWASSVGLYEKVKYTGLYKGIDLLAQSEKGVFEYDVLVAPYANYQALKMQYTGADKLSISREGHLQIETSLGTITEHIPEAYQWIDGKKVNVRCRYVLQGNTVGFACPDAYNRNYSLVIDPVLVASTYSGSLSTAMGWVSTNDKEGNMYATGICYGPGYPTTVGAYNTNYPGVSIMVINKIAPSGTEFIYATYLGGSNPSEFPRNSKLDKDGNLVLMGITSSFDFPVTSGAYDTTYTNPGDVDYFITKFNPTGTALLASTYLGGSGFDGYNNVLSLTNTGRERNEIAFDTTGNIFICGYTSSPDLPVTLNAYDTIFNDGLQQNDFGSQDGFVVKFNAGLTSLLYSTYLGGSAPDACYGMRLNEQGEIYVCGATQSSDFPTTPGSHHDTFQGDTLDGFILKLSSNGNLLLASTFVGTNGLEQVCFLDLDASGKPVVLGQTNAPENISAGCYGVPGSNQFISRYNASLSQREFYTVYGNGTDTNEFITTAFMLDNCGNIFTAGWSQDIFNFPVTSNALKDSTDGRDFHLMVLSPDADSLIYATFFGADYPESYGEHTDGGTCVFDKSGLITHVICQSAPNMETTPGAISSIKNSPSYDIAVYKLDFQTTVNADILVNPSTTLCAGLQVTFSNTGDAQELQWDFGDGSSGDSISNPQHTYTSVGNYEVRLVVTDSSRCNVSDTATVNITVVSGAITNFLGTDTTLCGAFQNITLDAGAASSWLWSNGQTSQTLVANAPGTYSVITNQSTSCPSRDTIVIAVASAPDLGADTTLCEGINFTLNAGAADSYLWNTGQTSQNITIDSSGTYVVRTTLSSCVFRDTAIITIKPLPVVNLGNDAGICPGDSLVLDAGNPGATYLWSTSAATRSIWVDAAGVYFVRVKNANCISTDTIKITSNPVPLVDLGLNPLICPGQNYTIDAGNPGATYLWSTGQNSQLIVVSNPGMYEVAVNNGFCTGRDSVRVIIDAVPLVNLGNDTLVSLPFTITLDAGVASQWLWNTGAETQKIDVVSADTYFVRVSSPAGCFSTDTIVIRLAEEKADINRPNVFTPNGDNLNDNFKVSIRNIRELQIEIYDRWGNLVSRSQFSGIPSDRTDFAVWDGRGKSGQAVDDGVYYYLLQGTGYDEKIFSSSGFVHLMQGR
jgi:gliding motility-associated-like protein